MAQASHITAQFQTGADARNAEVKLERAGIDGGHIQVQSTETLGRREQTRVENAATKDVAGRWIGVGLAAAIVFGALAFGVTLAITGDAAPGAVVAGLGGAIAGFILGGFYAAALRLPANPDALETYERNGDPTLLRIGVENDEEAETVRRVLEEAGGTLTTQ